MIRSRAVLVLAAVLVQVILVVVGVGPRLSARYTRIAFPDYVSWFDSPVCWFSAPGKLLRLDLQPPRLTPMLCVRGRTAENLAELCADIRGEWTLGQGT